MRLRFGLTVLLFAGGARATPAEAVDPSEQDEIEVTVSADRSSPRASSDPTSSSTRVDRERLRRPGASSADVLSEVAGAQVSRTGSSSELSTVSLRGASSSQTAVFLAGIRLNDDVTGTADLSRLPLWAMDRIEVHRGASPAFLDAWSMGGAVLLEPRVARRTVLEGRAGVGSFGHRGVALGASVGDGRSGALVSLEHERADNDFSYVDDGGTGFDPSDDRVVRRQNADHRHDEAWVVAALSPLPRVHTTLLMNAFEREQGTASVALLPALRARSRTRRQLFGVRSVVPCSATSSCQLDLSTHALLGRHRVYDPDDELTLGASHTDSDGLRLGQSARARLELAPLTVTLGASAESARIEVSGAERLVVRRLSARASGSVVAALHQRLTVQGMIGATVHDTRGPSRSTTDPLPDGRLGAVLAAHSLLALRANVGHALRPANLGELYGVSAGVRGNPALRPESAWSADAGVSLTGKGSRGSGSLDATLFQRWADDLVAYRRSSFGALTPYNVGRARFFGVELQALAEAYRVLRLQGSLTWLEPRDTSEPRTTRNDLVPFQSRLVSFTRLACRYDLGRAPLDALEIGLSARTRSSRVADPAGLIVLPANQLLGVDALGAMLAETLVLRIAVDNVLDQVQVDQLGFPLPGRSVFATATLTVVP